MNTHASTPVVRDGELLERMFREKDFLGGEIFHQVYGPDGQRCFERYHATGTLPKGVRKFCLEMLAGKHPRWLS